jgi:NUMOD3 motif
MKKGKKLSEETKRKISAAKLRNHLMRGKSWPEDVRQKIRAANIGQKRTELTKQNISNSLRRHWARDKEKRKNGMQL